MKLKGQGKKEYVVIRQWAKDDVPVISQVMTIKQAAHGVLYFEALEYYKVWMEKVITVKPQRI